MRIEQEDSSLGFPSAVGCLGGDLPAPKHDEQGRRRYVLNQRVRESSEPKEAEAVHIRGYVPANWMTAAGVIRKRRQIEAKGLPKLHRWRFITLTIDPERFPDGPLSAYLAARDYMRRFLKKCRDGRLWAENAKWCWKLEFQENGWPHWHLLVSRTTKFSEVEMAEIGRLWGLGRTNCEMVNEADFAYSFKYAFKPVHQLDSDFDDSAPMAPQWFLDYYEMVPAIVEWTDSEAVKHREQTMKPATGSKVRFWQTSRGFYTGEKSEAPAARPPETCRVPFTVRTVADKLASTVQVVARKSCGKYVASACILLTCSVASLWTHAGWHAINGGAAFLGVNSAVVPSALLKKNTENTSILCQLLKQNRMTVNQAVRLQPESRNWRTS